MDPSKNNPKEVIRGRGAPQNPPNRFKKIIYDKDPDVDPTELPSPKTQFFKDPSRTLISYNESPDVGFEASINPYRGCEHGCIYCYARPTHEYLGLSSGLDFESKILVKEKAPLLLRKDLSSKNWKPKPLALSGVTDPYQPIEKKLEITRQCLSVLLEFKNPVVIVTKNHLITRDIDILSQLASTQCAAVFISITTLDEELRLKLEPRTSTAMLRLKTVEELSKANIPVGVLIAPVIPGLTDHELPKIIEESTRKGAKFFGYSIVRLPHAVSYLFERWLEEHFPDRKEKVLNRIREIRGGKLNDSRFGYRMRGEGLFVNQLEQLFDIACKKAKVKQGGPLLSTAFFRVPSLQTFFNF